MIAKVIATVGGIGRVPRLPGTVASVVGVGLAWWLSPHPAMQIAGCLAVTALGFWSAGPASRAMGVKDPPAVVIDEVAGMMISLVLLPATWKIYLAGFLLFRFLDIFKPGPIRRLECLPGGVGIMADDLLAGVVTNLLLRLAGLF
ncbi:MAG: phosphatidylglycerophosphatase A [Candidatus Omnitrophota bacterium]|nr:phosphatidylglycerophosphatase A [Candidatus Omnitrophota bacterium]